MRSIAWVLALCGGAMALGACSRGQSPSKAAPAASAPMAAAPAEPLEIEGRRIDIRVTEKGYEPNVVPVKADEQVTLVFTRTVPSDCLAEIALPSLGVKKPLPMNQPVAIPVRPVKSGQVVFACGMDMIRGMITVD